MRCIVCLQERPESLEHVFPLAIGGSLELLRVCRDCNSFLGSKVDTGLTNFAPILWKRGELGIAGNSRIAPGRFNMLDGEARLVSDPDRRMRVKYNQTSNKLDVHSIHHKREVEQPDGTKAIQIIVDDRDRESIPKIIQRERKRHGVEPLTVKQMEDYLQTLEVQTIDNPILMVNTTINFAFLRHAMIKIVYELAFIWLGEAYLDDPYAKTFRDALVFATAGSTDDIFGYAGLVLEQSAFAVWEPHPNHHLAYAVRIEDQIVIAVRVFDVVEAVFPVTAQAGDYLKNNQPQHGHFLAIDSLSGVLHRSSLLAENMRLDTWVRIYLRDPPFPDPLVNGMRTPSLNSSDGFTCSGVPWSWGWSWRASTSQ